MKNSTPQSQVIWARHCSNLYVYVSKINLWFTGIQVNHNMSFKRITLLFVYFWQAIFFWAVMLHITKSNIENIRKRCANNSFVRTPELQILFETFFSHVNFQQRFSILVVYQVTLILQIRRIQKTRTTRKNKITNQGCTIT